MKHTTELVKKPRGPFLDPLWLARCTAKGCHWNTVADLDSAQRAARSHAQNIEADKARAIATQPEGARP